MAYQSMEPIDPRDAFTITARLDFKRIIVFFQTFFSYLQM